LSATIDYYFAPNSPWTYLGHARLVAMARDAGAAVRVLPMDLGGKVFPISGGLPLGKRAPQRQDYRLVELARFSNYLGLPLNVKPKYFPVDPDSSARLIVGVDLEDGPEAAMRLSETVFQAVWVKERNIADEQVLADLLAECRLAPGRLEFAHSQTVSERYEANTEAAIAAGVFGAPSYVLDGELFWGQDRLDFLQRKLGV